MNRSDAIAAARGPLALTNENFRLVIDREKTQTRRLPSSRPPYRVGDILYLTEPVQIEELDTSENVVAIEYLWSGWTAAMEISKKDKHRILARKRGWSAPTNARFMLKALARDFVRITGFKTERLQEISEDDAVAEGCSPVDPSNYSEAERLLLDYPLLDDFRPYANHFSIIWLGIHGEGAWEQNPVVRAYTFERMEVAHG